MKTRHGFVSNSSSSSFILSLDKKPETVEEMKQLLFGDAEFYDDPYYDADSTYFSERTAKYPALEVAKTVFDDLKDQPSMDKAKVAEELGSGWAEIELDDGSKAPSYDDFRVKGDNGDCDWEAYQKASDIFFEKAAKELIKESKEKELYVVSYSDDCSYGCALEHGTLFDKVDHFRISHH